MMKTSTPAAKDNSISLKNTPYCETLTVSPSVTTKYPATPRLSAKIHFTGPEPAPWKTSTVTTENVVPIEWPAISKQSPEDNYTDSRSPASHKASMVTM